MDVEVSRESSIISYVLLLKNHMLLAFLKLQNRKEAESLEDPHGSKEVCVFPFVRTSDLSVCLIIYLSV